MFKCSVCLEVVYCSQSRQKEDWKVHKIVCKALEAKRQKDDSAIQSSFGSNFPDAMEAWETRVGNVLLSLAFVVFDGRPWSDYVLRLEMEYKPRRTSGSSIKVLSFKCQALADVKTIEPALHDAFFQRRPLTKSELKVDGYIYVATNFEESGICQTQRVLFSLPGPQRGELFGAEYYIRIINNK